MLEKPVSNNQVMPKASSQVDGFGVLEVFNEKNSKIQHENPDARLLGVSKGLNMADIIEAWSRSRTLRSLGQAENTPFLRLHAALLSSSASAQTKLIRANSFDMDSRDQSQRKNAGIFQVATATIPLADKQKKPKQEVASNKPQLQKELILASSKTMARERVRDFALSLHKSPFKDEYTNEAAVDRRVKRRAKQKGAGGMSRLLAPLFKEDAMDGSLAESTDEDGSEVGTF
jgi:hypothetical protein